jgi:tryptophan-rich sensory protein
MIQRIQTLYFILVAVLMSIFISSPLYKDMAAGIDTPGSSPLDLATVGIAVLILIVSLVSALLYKKRPLQIQLSWLTAFLHVALIVVSILVIYPLLGQSDKYAVGFGAILPVISLILTLLAIRGVKKDEKLVRGADRLR